MAARALVAKLLIRKSEWQAAAQALSGSGPWQVDPLCRNRLAFAAQQEGGRARAARLAEANLRLDPLDAFAVHLLLTGSTPGRETPAYDPRTRTEATLDLAGDLLQLGQFESASQLARGTAEGAGGLQGRWARVWPHREEEVGLLRREAAQQPPDGRAVLNLGHLLFHLGRHAEGRAMWRQAAELGAEPVVAYRALGMAAKTLDGDLTVARDWLARGNEADPKDAIVARDLANVLFALADKAGAELEARDLILQARDRLQGGFEEGKGRSDFVALLARSYSRLGDHAATARLLDSVRITIWEGAREAHDLFEEAHLALGDEHWTSGLAAAALVEFNRALEYPENLATGRLENTREAHIQYRRCYALMALGRKDEAIAAWRKAAAEPASKEPTVEEVRKKAAAALHDLELGR